VLRKTDVWGREGTLSNAPAFGIAVTPPISRRAREHGGPDQGLLPCLHRSRGKDRHSRRSVSTMLNLPEERTGRAHSSRFNRCLGFRLIHSQNARAVASATPERKLV